MIDAGWVAIRPGDDRREKLIRLTDVGAAKLRDARPAWELRATMSLARLWQRQGRRDEAHAALAAVYGTFTEGFTTPDLVDARALLKALA